MLAATVVAMTMVSGQVQYLERPEGRVAYELFGERGPLVICVPGLGDVRAQYRFLVEPLVESGHRVVLMDLRGLGDSDVGFSDHSARAVGEDIAALVRKMGAERTFVVGNSMAAAAAVYAAAELPEAIEGMVLIGPFVRDVPAPFFMPALMNVAFRPPWGRALWMKYYQTLYPQRLPDDYDVYSARLSDNLSEPGRMGNVLKMILASKAPCEARIPEVKARTLVIMGSADPDFSDPAEEANLVARRLNGSVLMVEGVGHYPHAEKPAEVIPPLLTFLRGAHHGS